MTKLQLKKDIDKVKKNRIDCNYADSVLKYSYRLFHKAYRGHSHETTECVGVSDNIVLFDYRR